MEKNKKENPFPQADVEPSSLFKDVRVLIGILSLAGIIAGSIVAGLFSLKESQANNQTSQIKLLVEQTTKNYNELRLEFNVLKEQLAKKDLFINQLTRENLNLQIELTNKNIELVKLQALSEGVVSDKDLAQKLVDSLRFPAWIKEYDETENKFRMFVMNEIYTAVYGKTKKDYIGFTDYDLYSKEIAAQYELGDFEALNNYNSIKVAENTLKNGESFTETSIKFRIEFNDEKKYVGGFIITGNYVEIQKDSSVNY